MSGEPISDERITAKTFIPIAKRMSEAAFCAKYDHPFLFGREVLEEEFQFATVVTGGQSLEQSPFAQPASIWRVNLSISRPLRTVVGMYMNGPVPVTMPVSRIQTS